MKRLITVLTVAALPFGATAQPFWSTATPSDIVHLAKEKHHGHNDDRDDRKRSKRLQSNHKINPTYGSKKTVRKKTGSNKLFFTGSFFKTGLFFQ